MEGVFVLGVLSERTECVKRVSGEGACVQPCSEIISVCD